MDIISALQKFDALSQKTRLQAFQLLLAEGADGLPAGEIAHELGAAANTMSTHLALLERSGLIRSERQGRSIHYRANLEGINELIGFLVEDCCHGNPQICVPLLTTLVQD
jgi:ArsR family transcriptional regulator, arsenate/arsenite/antimonite-responsive transcriptional repressor